MSHSAVRSFGSWAVTFLLVAGVGCGSEEPGPDPDPDPVAKTTWHQDVAPIVHKRCVGCHTAGGIAPFTLETFEDAGPIAALMLAKIESGEMPPWHAVVEEDCAPRFNWKDDPRLTPAEEDTMRAWVADGAPEGDANDPAELPRAPEYELSGVTDSYTPVQPYTTSGYRDEQICFLLDPQLATARWMTGLQVNPDNLEVAHHGVVMAIPPENADAIRTAAGANGTFDCFGAVGLEGAYTLGIWVPGARPFEAPGGSGIPIAPGTVFVLNMHYHPTGYDHEPDNTTVDLRLTSEQPEKTFFVTAFGNVGESPVLQPGPNDRGGVAEFFIPAMVKDHTEKMVFEVDSEDPRSFPMTAMFPHMHYVGVSMQVKIIRANPAPGQPAEECLMNIPRWDFDWQRTYFYDVDVDELPTIANGDRVEIKCSYNNTPSNPFVLRMLDEEGLTLPVDVELGDETTDEMCLIGVGVVF